MRKVVVTVFIINICLYAAAFFSYSEGIKACKDCCVPSGEIPFLGFYDWDYVGNVLLIAGLGSDLGLATYLISQIHKPKQKLG